MREYMSDEQKPIEKMPSLEDRHLEREIHRKIGKDLFKKMMSQFDIDLSLIFEDNRINLKHAAGFNRLLTHLKRANLMEISECLIYIEEEYASFKKIRTVLNDENLEIVKRELAVRHRIKLTKNSLENFIYE